MDFRLTPSRWKFKTCWARRRTRVILFRRRSFRSKRVDTRSQPHLSRREFMQGAAIIGAAPLIGRRGAPADEKTPPEEPEGTVPKKTLGRTGVQVSAIGIGGYHLGSA